MKRTILFAALALMGAALAGTGEVLAQGGKAPAKKAAAVQRTTVTINGGYQPATVKVKAGKPVALTFVHKEKAGCGDVVQIPSLGIKRTLTYGQKTVVTFTPKKTGTLRFTCGMDMYNGSVVVQ